MILDLEEVEFLDSSPLRTIIELRRTAREWGSRVTVEPGPHEAQRIFALTYTTEIAFGP